MSALSKPGVAAPILIAVLSKREVKSERRRSISPEAGRALELLGHSIEYLTDEFVHRRGSLCVHDPEFEAIQLLMARNREIYLACPVVASLRERVGALAQSIMIRVLGGHGRWLVHSGRAAR